MPFVPFYSMTEVLVRRLSFAAKCACHHYPLKYLILQYSTSKVAPYLITLDILRYLDVMQRSEDEFAALKDQIKAAKDAKKKVKNGKGIIDTVMPVNKAIY